MSRQDAPQVEVIGASLDQQSLIANMLELYIHDFSEFFDVELGEDGKYGYPSLSRHWSEPERYPFLIRADGKLAGFALVKRGSELSGDHEVWDLAEFFVLRGYRHRRVGTLAAHELWKMLPGAWEVRVMQSNTGARRFWARAIEEYMRNRIDPALIEKNGRLWDSFSFESERQDTGEVSSR